jgi:hypothetical protein
VDAPSRCCPHGPLSHLCPHEGVARTQMYGPVPRALPSLPSCDVASPRYRASKTTLVFGASTLSRMRATANSCAMGCSWHAVCAVSRSPIRIPSRVTYPSLSISKWVASHHCCSRALSPGPAKTMHSHAPQPFGVREEQQASQNYQKARAWSALVRFAAMSVQASRSAGRRTWRLLLALCCHRATDRSGAADGRDRSAYPRRISMQTARSNQPAASRPRARPKTADERLRHARSTILADSLRKTELT